MHKIGGIVTGRCPKSLVRFSGILLLCLILCEPPVCAQTDSVLMRVDGRDVLRPEFEVYLEQSGRTGLCDTATLHQMLRQYASMVCLSQAAKALKLDTSMTVCDELAQYRARFLEASLIDRASLEQLARHRYEAWKTRNEFGRIKVRQLFVYLPQNVSAETLRVAEERIDSLYGVLKNGDMTESAALDLQVKDTIFWITKLQMPVEFEDSVFCMEEGGLTAPFFTPQGIQIVKVLEKEDFPTYEEVKDKIKDRLMHEEHSVAVLVRKKVEDLKRRLGYHPNAKGMEELLLYGHTKHTLFMLDGKPYDGFMFSLFAKSHFGEIRQLLEDFVTKAVLDYEDACLTVNYPAFRWQSQVFCDSVLAKAAKTYEDSLYGPLNDLELAAFFDSHRVDYEWKEPRYRGIVIHCRGRRTARRVRRFLKSLPENEWDDAVRLVFNADGKKQLLVEQGTFRPGDNAYVDDEIFKRTKARSKDGYPFQVFIGRKLQGPETFQEIRSLVEKDCRADRRKRFLTSLHLSGKVEINQEVLKTVNNQ